MTRPHGGPALWLALLTLYLVWGSTFVSVAVVLRRDAGRPAVEQLSEPSGSPR